MEQKITYMMLYAAMVTCGQREVLECLDRMLFGLLTHNLRFFASENVVNLEAPKD